MFLNLERKQNTIFTRTNKRWGLIKKYTNRHIAVRKVPSIHLDVLRVHPLSRASGRRRKNERPLETVQRSTQRASNSEDKTRRQKRGRGHGPERDSPHSELVGHRPLEGGGVGAQPQIGEQSVCPQPPFDLQARDGARHVCGSFSLPPRPPPRPKALSLSRSLAFLPPHSEWNVPRTVPAEAVLQLFSASSLTRSLTPFFPAIRCRKKNFFAPPNKSQYMNEQSNPPTFSKMRWASENNPPPLFITLHNAHAQLPARVLEGRRTPSFPPSSPAWTISPFGVHK